MIVTFIAIAILFFSVSIEMLYLEYSSDGCPMLGRTPQYWYTAPDGRYEVLFYETLNTDGSYNGTMVWFPMCPSYGGQLHGCYNLTEGLVIPKEFEVSEYLVGSGRHVIYGWCWATLTDNTIIKLEWIDK